MGLAETQRLLAHLLTDGGLRELFRADPDGVGADWGLGPDDIRAVSQLSADQINGFAQSLQTKRLGEVRKLLPHTCRVLGPHAALLFRRFADLSVPSGIHRHRADALGFAAFLIAILPEEKSLPSWLADVLRYEVGWLTVSDPDCRWHVCATRRDIASVARALDTGETPAASRHPALAAWWRLSACGPIQHRIFWLPYHTRA